MRQEVPLFRFNQSDRHFDFVSLSSLFYLVLGYLHRGRFLDTILTLRSPVRNDTIIRVVCLQGATTKTHLVSIRCRNLL